MELGYRENRKTTDCPDVLDPVTVYNGVDYSLVYDYKYYTEKYSDIKNAFGNDDISVLEHFVRNGMKEGRQASASFNVYTYENSYNDLKNAFGDDLPKYYVHYINNGYKENRKGA